MKKLIFPFLLVLLSAIPANAKINTLSPANCNAQNDALFVTHYIDSLMEELTPEDQLTYSSGSFYYAPGNWFKIMVIEGVGCGAYCNPNFVSLMMYEKDGKLITEEADFCPIWKIDPVISKKGQHSFLIMENYGARPRGIETAIYYSALHLIVDDSIHLGKFIHANDPDNPQEGFTASLSIFCSDSAGAHQKEGDYPLFHYDAEKKELTYRTFYYNDGDWERCYLMAGKFVYRKGVFVEVEAEDGGPVMEH